MVSSSSDESDVELGKDSRSGRIINPPSPPPRITANVSSTQAIITDQPPLLSQLSQSSASVISCIQPSLPSGINGLSPVSVAASVAVRTQTSTISNEYPPLPFLPSFDNTPVNTARSHYQDTPHRSSFNIHHGQITASATASVSSTPVTTSTLLTPATSRNVIAPNEMANEEQNSLG